ncbi:MAG: isoprenyl transferase [Bacteroidales bacterium]|nr:isoprenyl transferase [Bacteroidales bacterium]
MSLKDQIDKSKLPTHVAIIMDGNGRWAKKKGNPRVFGHQNGVEAVRDTVEASAELGLGYLTLYAFSTENWKRPRTEVDALMTLLVSTINKETKTLLKNNIQLKAIGDLASLPKSVAKKLDEAIEKTSSNTGLNLILALSYSARWEINNAVKNILIDYQDKNPEEINIDDNIFRNYLTTKDYPDPELLIRTSGENRISNFLLWQIAYSELYFTQTLWPDFRREDLYVAIADYQKRERRFGKISEQINTNNTNNC